MTHCLLLSGGGLAVKVAQEEASGFQLVYFGPASALAVTDSIQRPVLPAGPDTPAGPRLLAQRGDGYAGLGVIDAVCLADGRAAVLQPVSMERTCEDGLTLRSCDDEIGLIVEVDILLAHGLMKMRTRLRNSGAHAVLLIRCAALQLPLMDWAEEIVSGFGSWAREGHESRRSLEGGFVGKSAR